MRHIVDIDYKSGTRCSFSFDTQAEAVAHAARMAMDMRVKFAGVRGLAMDATITAASVAKELKQLGDVGTIQVSGDNITLPGDGDEVPVVNITVSGNSISAKAKYKGMPAFNGRFSSAKALHDWLFSI